MTPFHYMIQLGTLFWSYVLEFTKQQQLLFVDECVMLIYIFHLNYVLNFKLCSI